MVGPEMKKSLTPLIFFLHYELWMFNTRESQELK